MKYVLSVFLSLTIVSCVTDRFVFDADPTISKPSGIYTTQVDAVAGYTYGDSREPLMAVEDLIREVSGDPAKINALADDMAHALTQSGTTRDAKDFICRQLWIIGQAEHVPHIASLLKRSDTADMARYALVNIPGTDVDAVLIQTLNDAPDSVRIGILNTLGERGANGALSDISGARRAIRAYRNAGNEDLAAAARDALARI